MEGFVDPVAAFQEHRAQTKPNTVSPHFGLRQLILLHAEQLRDSHKPPTEGRKVAKSP